MNLAILIGRFPPGPQGGAEHQAEGWARRLADRHRVVVITRREPGGPEGRQERDGFSVMRLPLARVPVWRTWSDAERIERTLRTLEPRPDLLLCFQTFISGWAGVRVQRRWGVPAVVWIRGEGEYRLGDRSIEALLNPGTWSDARGVLVQSEEGRQALLEALDRHAPARRAVIAAHLDVVPNGLDLPQLPPTDTARHGGVLTVGRLIPDKGMDIVIDAVAGLGGRLTIAGDGPDGARLEARARERGLDAHFAGFVARERIGDLYAHAACVVLAARRGEGLPNVLLEAMAWGRPVVATPVAGVRGLLVDGVNGLVIPPDDADALGAALKRLERDPALAQRLGDAARRTAEGYAWDRVRPRLESILARWRRTP
jgi:glycosyltransferase involved in cell wall biosynthesis